MRPMWGRAMTLLTMTVCVATIGSIAECHTSIWILATMLEYRKRSDAMAAHITETAQAPVVKVIFPGSERSRGVDV